MDEKDRPKLNYAPAGDRRWRRQRLYVWLAFAAYVTVASSLIALAARSLLK